MCVLQRFVVDLLVTACTGSVGALIEAVHCTGIFTQERVCCGWLWWQVGAIQARLKPGLEFVHLVDPADANVNATAALAFRAQVSTCVSHTQQAVVLRTRAPAPPKRVQDLTPQEGWPCCRCFMRLCGCMRWNACA